MSVTNILYRNNNTAGSWYLHQWLQYNALAHNLGNHSNHNYYQNSESTRILLPNSDTSSHSSHRITQPSLTSHNQHTRRTESTRASNSIPALPNIFRLSLPSAKPARKLVSEPTISSSFPNNPNFNFKHENTTTNTKLPKTASLETPLPRNPHIRSSSKMDTKQAEEIDTVSLFSKWENKREKEKKNGLGEMGF